MIVAVLAAVSVALIVAALLVLHLRGRRPGRHMSVADYRTMVELHTIRRRFDVAWFKLALKRDVADAQLRLCAELDELERRERL